MNIFKLSWLNYLINVVFDGRHMSWKTRNFFHSYSMLFFCVIEIYRICLLHELEDKHDMCLSVPSCVTFYVSSIKVLTFFGWKMFCFAFENKVTWSISVSNAVHRMNFFNTVRKSRMRWKNINLISNEGVLSFILRPLR